jgi:hypothetical protein
MTSSTMERQKVVSRAEWLGLRKELLAKVRKRKSNFQGGVAAIVNTTWSKKPPSQEGEA